jgi:hypothetical protein
MSLEENLLTVDLLEKEIKKLKAKRLDLLKDRIKLLRSLFPIVYPIVAISDGYYSSVRRIIIHVAQTRESAEKFLKKVFDKYPSYPSDKAKIREYNWKKDDYRCFLISTFSIDPSEYDIECGEPVSIDTISDKMVSMLAIDDPDNIIPIQNLDCHVYTDIYEKIDFGDFDKMFPL